MIFGCLAFTFYILLLFFHRMYSRLSSGKEKKHFYTRGEKQSLWGGRHGRRRLLTRHECTSVPRKIQGNVYFFYSFLFPSSSWAVQLSVWDGLTHGFSMRGRAMNLASSIPSCHGPMGENLSAALQHCKAAPASWAVSWPTA